MFQLERIERRLDRIEELLWHVIEVQEQQIACGVDAAKVLALDADVKKRTHKLKAAVAAAQPPTPIALTPGGFSS